MSIIKTGITKTNNMETLTEQFQQVIINNFDGHPSIIINSAAECESIADEAMIEFAKWLNKEFMAKRNGIEYLSRDQDVLGFFTPEQLLPRFKKEFYK